MPSESFVTSVPSTAHWMAAARAVETERGDGSLFRDPLARRLAGPKGFALLDRYKGGGLVDFVAIRTRYLDDCIRFALEGTQIRQVVLIAAGLDTRAYRMSWPSDAVVYEVDLPDLLIEKAEKLTWLGTEPGVTLRRVHADLTVDWLAELEDNGFVATRPVLWVAEGLLFYLTGQQAAALLRTMNVGSPPGSWLAADLVNEQLLRTPATRSFISALRAGGIPWQFGTDDLASFLQANGWDEREVKEPGERGAGQDRWRYPVQPADVRHAPRHWLFQATWSPWGDGPQPGQHHSGSGPRARDTAEKVIQL